MKKVLTITKEGERNILFEQNVLNECIISVGNNPDATLELKDKAIAPEQFVIVSKDEEMLLMNRADGTIINGESLDLGSQISLHVGDEIKIGEFHVHLSTDEINGLFEVVKNNVESNESLQKKAEEAQKNGNDFSTVLNNLKEEDSFYFHIIDDENVNERILFDSDVIWVGISFAESSIKKDKNELDEVYACVKKDWSGAVIYPENLQKVYLNGELLEDSSRLQDNDELVLDNAFEAANTHRTKITFHEPVALLALNSILPEELPEPVSLNPNELDSIHDSSNLENIIQNSPVNNSTKENIQPETKKRLILGYFTILEVIIMAIGTLVTSAIIFLVLEFV
jgi:hypothetical protein